MNSNTNAHRLLPVAQWNQFHPWPTVAAMRNLVFKAQRNGLATAVRRVGRRVLIDEAEFFLWVDRIGGCDGHR